MATKINTVTGQISPEELGITLMHEHLVFGYAGWQFDTASPPCDRRAVLDSCVKQILEAREIGIGTIVDATPNDGSRDPELYRMASEKTGVNIICSTGLFNESQGASAYFRARAAYNKIKGDFVKEIYEIFMMDLTCGIGDTGVKAGIIKVGTGRDKITPCEEAVLEAAAMAQKEARVPIITHTEGGTMGPGQAEFLISRGADPDRVIIGHMCARSDLQYHFEVLGKGVYAGLDRFGLGIITPDSERLNTLAALLGAGYEKQVIISQDFVIKWLGRELIRPAPDSPVSDWSLTHISRNIVPALKKAGIRDDQVKTLMVDNPLRIFEGRS